MGAAGRRQERAPARRGRRPRPHRRTRASACARSPGCRSCRSRTRSATRSSQDDPDAVASAIAREIGDGTLLLDALHAADPDTLDVIARLAGRVALGVAYRTPVPPQLGSLLDRAGFATIALEPLEPAAGDDLATLHRPRLRRARIDAMVQRGRRAARRARRARDRGRRRRRARSTRPRAGRPSSERRDPRRRTLREEADRVRAALDPVLALRDRPSAAAQATASSPRPARRSPRSATRARSSAPRRRGDGARGRESGEAAARVALGEALFVGGDPSCLGHFEAVVRSLAEIDAEVVYEAAYGLVAGRYAFGDPALGPRARKRDGEPRARRSRPPLRGDLPAHARASRPARRRRLRGDDRRGPPRAAGRRGHARGLPGAARHGDLACRAGSGRPGRRRLPHRRELGGRRPAGRDAGARGRRDRARRRTARSRARGRPRGHGDRRRPA